MRVNLKLWLIENKKQAQQVAKELGVTTSYFSQIVSGNKNPSMELLDRFYDLYSEITEDVYLLFRKR